MFSQTQINYLTNENHYGVVAVINPRSHYPHQAPVWIGYYKEKLYIITTNKSAKYRYISEGSNKIGINILPASGYPYLSIIGNAAVRVKSTYNQFKEVVEIMVKKYVEEKLIEERIEKIMTSDEHIIIEVEPIHVFGQVK
ncbi:MAG: pyridoxamine 5'-phosphate oxidase family protein [Candidatus Heimdallarchaeota archaeon]|nr:pyridoxamine 5'-phosphate oxidase family protein [Candidatus Heimdallarchaeota archaeon]